MAGFLELLGLKMKSEPKSPPPRAEPNEWDEDGERKTVREALKTLQSDDLRVAGATESELQQLQAQIQAVEDAIDDYIYMMPQAELDELKSLRERVRKQIESRNKTQKTESPSTGNVEPKATPVEKPTVAVVSEESRKAKEAHAARLNEFMPRYNETHGKSSPFQKNRLATALKKATDAAAGDTPDYAKAETALDEAERVVSLVNTDLASKTIYEQSLEQFKTKYDPVFEIADGAQKKRLSGELGKVTAAAAAEDPDFAQVESMFMLIEPLIEQIQLEIQAAEEEEQRLIDEALRAKQKQILTNQSRLAEAISDLDRYAKLTAAVLPKRSEKLRKSHAAAVKMNSENAVTEDSGPIEALEVESVEEISFLEVLAEYQPRYLAVYAPSPNAPAQKELKKIYDAAIKLAGKEDFEEAGRKLYDDLDKKLADAEGEPIYTSAFEEVEVEYDRIASDADATMPDEAMRQAYVEAQRLATEEGKFPPAIKLLRGILLLVPKVDAYTNKYKLVKPTYQGSQTSDATSAQKKAIEAVLKAAQDCVKDGEPAEGMKKLDDLTVKIKEVATATERRTKSSKFPSVVPKAEGKGMQKLDDAKKLLGDGGMTAENVMKMIPKGVNNSWHGSKNRFDKGFEYEWEGPEPEKIKYHVHGHTKDKNHETGNSGTGAVVRIRVGDSWLKSDGTLTSSLYDDDAHVPMY